MEEDDIQGIRFLDDDDLASGASFHGDDSSHQPSEVSDGNGADQAAEHAHQGDNASEPHENETDAHELKAEAAIYVDQQREYLKRQRAGIVSNIKQLTKRHESITKKLEGHKARFLALEASTYSDDIERARRIQVDMDLLRDDLNHVFAQLGRADLELERNNHQIQSLTHVIDRATREHDSIIPDAGLSEDEWGSEE